MPNQSIGGTPGRAVMPLVARTRKTDTTYLIAQDLPPKTMSSKLLACASLGNLRKARVVGRIPEKMDIKVCPVL